MRIRSLWHNNTVECTVCHQSCLVSSIKSTITRSRRNTRLWKS